MCTGSLTYYEQIVRLTRNRSSCAALLEDTGAEGDAATTGDAQMALNVDEWQNEMKSLGAFDDCATVGRCLLKVSRPVLKAPMVSALETITS